MSSYDYVVGAGTATRLSENASVRVLVVEAGPADGPPTMTTACWPDRGWHGTSATANR